MIKYSLNIRIKISKPKALCRIHMIPQICWFKIKRILSSHQLKSLKNSVFSSMLEVVRTIILRRWFKMFLRMLISKSKQKICKSRFTAWLTKFWKILLKSKMQKKRMNIINSAKILIKLFITIGKTGYLKNEHII